MRKGIINGVEIECDDLGGVFVCGKRLPQHDNGNGYMSVDIGRKRFYVHRIACYFYNGGDISSKLHVNHKNGVRGDNRPDNLEWMTCSDNAKHAYRELGRRHPKNQTGKSGFNHQYSKPIDQINKDTGEIIKTWGSMREAAIAMGVSQKSIYCSVYGKDRVKNIKGFKWRLNPLGNKYVSKFIYYFEDGKRKRKLRVHE